MSSELPKLPPMRRRTNPRFGQSIAERHTKDHEVERTYEEWKRQVNNHVHALSGLDADDLDDWDYQTAYIQGVAPSVAAKRAVRNAMRNSGF